MEEIWGVFKDIIYEALQKFVPCKILKNNPDPEYYIANIRRMKRITRKAFKNRKRSSEHINIFRNRSKELERKKKIVQEAYLKNILDGKGNNWTFYKYVRRRKGNKEDVPVIRENGSTLITDNRAKVDAFNKYFSSVFKNSTDHPFIQVCSVANQFNIEVNVLLE